MKDLDERSRNYLMEIRRKAEETGRLPRKSEVPREVQKYLRQAVKAGEMRSIKWGWNRWYGFIRFPLLILITGKRPVPGSIAGLFTTAVIFW